MIQVAARRAGIIRDVLVNEGDAVVRGQILARQEEEEPRLAAGRASAALSEARAQLDALEVTLSTARRERERLQALVSSNFVAGQKLDQADDQVRKAEADLASGEAAVETARAALAQSQYELEQTLVRAPAVDTLEWDLDAQQLMADWVENQPVLVQISAAKRLLTVESAAVCH
jgi:HlyD family secretion protein